MELDTELHTTTISTCRSVDGLGLRVNFAALPPRSRRASCGITLATRDGHATGAEECRRGEAEAADSVNKLPNEAPRIGIMALQLAPVRGMLLHEVLLRNGGRSAAMLT
jgi:hypothetical protein